MNLFKKCNNNLSERYKLRTHPKLIKTLQIKKRKNKTVTEAEITGQYVNKCDKN